MKFSELVRWILLLAILVVIVFWASIPSSNLVGSIVFSHLHHGVGGTTVQNGSAFDQAVIDLDKYQRLILPDDAKVHRKGNGTEVLIFMKKTLEYYGHPPKSMSIQAERNNMGCAVNAAGDALVLGTFGEWDSHFHGGSQIQIILVVPSGIEVEKRAGLSGEKSAAQEHHVGLPVSRAEGWLQVPEVPDPERRFWSD